jgi:hypothetical protein
MWGAYVQPHTTCGISEGCKKGLTNDVGVDIITPAAARNGGAILENGIENQRKTERTVRFLRE